VLFSFPFFLLLIQGDLCDVDVGVWVSPPYAYN